MAITRAEGYRRGAGKEAAALRTFEDFLATKVGTDYRFIDTYNENWLYGDYELNNGKYIEVKGQPIDPARYPENFVELGEITTNEKHVGGYEKLKALLDLPKLDNKLVKTGSTGPVSPMISHAARCFSLSITSLSNNTTYVYINSDKGIIYLYTAAKLIEAIKNAINSSKPMYRGLGNSNQDSIAVKVALPKAIWYKIDDEWVYKGTVEEEAVLDYLRK